jgi:hypothetical protein
MRRERRRRGKEMSRKWKESEGTFSTIMHITRPCEGY